MVKIGPNDDYPSSITDLVINELVSVKEEDEIKGLKIYPNPSNKILNVSLDNSSYEGIRIINSLGSEIYHSEFHNIGSINVSQYESGMYIIELSGVDVTTIRRQVVVK